MSANLPPAVARRIASLDAHVASRWPLLGQLRQHHLTTTGRPLSIADAPFQVEILKVLHRARQMVISKAVQVRITEATLIKAFYAAGWEGKTVGYVLSAKPARDDFVTRRINKQIRRVPAYRARLRDTNSLKLKEFGEGWLIFIAATVESDFYEVPLDVAIVDELNVALRRNEDARQNLARLPDRLKASAAPQEIFIGNPTLPGFGISRRYDRSDRRRWFQRCPRCNEWQVLDWFLHFVEKTPTGWIARDRAREPRVGGDASAGDIRPVCTRCHRPWERPAGGRGAWVAADQAAEVRGYTCWQADVLTRPLRPLLTKWRTAQGSELDVNGDAALADQGLCAGIDVGNILHITIGRRRSHRGVTTRPMVFAGTTGSFEAAADILDRFRVRMLVIDARPDWHKAKEFRRYLQQRGRKTGRKMTVWLCQFSPGVRIGAEKYAKTLKEDEGVIQVDRYQLLSAMVDTFTGGIGEDALPSIVLPGDILGSVDQFADQMQVPRRELQPDGSRFKWTKGNDHYFLTTAYLHLACDLLGAGHEWRQPPPANHDSARHDARPRGAATGRHGSRPRGASGGRGGGSRGGRGGRR